MKLPKLDTPTYRMKLMSIPGEVVYRPFLVKEQKILLMAAQSKDPVEIVDALKDCVKSCTMGVVDANKLPSFDLIMMFLKIRAKSVGELLELKYTCDHTTEDEEGIHVCGTEIEFSVNLEEIDYSVEEGHSPIIQLSESVGLRMKYPTIEDATRYTNLRDPSQQLAFIMDSIECIFSDEQMIERDEIPNEELEDFVDQFTADQLTALMKFFDTQPKVSHTKELVCPKCGTSRTLGLSDIEDFF